MGSLEQVLSNIGTGAMMSAGRAIDPLGASLAQIENTSVTAKGEASPESLNNLNNTIQRTVSPITDESLPILTGHLPRLAGKGIGYAGTGVAAYGMYAAIGPWSLVLPAAIAGYSALNAVFKYVDVVFEPKPEGYFTALGNGLGKGFVHGFHRGISPLLEPFYIVENAQTARGHAGSHIEGPITDSAQEVPREITSPVGIVAGAGIGLGVNGALGYGAYTLAAIAAPVAAIPVGIIAAAALPLITGFTALKKTIGRRFRNNYNPQPATATT